MELPWNVHETCEVTGGGTGPLELLGAVSGARAFGTGLSGDGVKTLVFIANDDASKWQECLVQYDAGDDELVVVQVKNSSNGGAAVAWDPPPATMDVNVSVFGAPFEGFIDPDSQPVGILRRTGPDAYGALATPIELEDGGHGESTVADALAAWGTKEVRADVAANIGAAGDHPDSLFYATDTRVLSYSNGSTWASFTVEDGLIDTDQIADLGADTADIDNDAVGATELAPDTVSVGAVDDDAGPISVPSSLSYTDLAVVTLNDAGSRILFFIEADSSYTGGSSSRVRIVRDSDGAEVVPDKIWSEGTSLRARYAATLIAGAEDTYRLQAKRSFTFVLTSFSNVYFSAMAPRLV